MHWLRHVQSVIAAQHCYQNAVVSFCRKSSPKNLLPPWFNTEMPEEIRLFTGRWSWKDTKAYCMPAVMTSHLAHTTEHKDNSEDELLLESPGKSNKKHLKRLATLAQNKHFFSYADLLTITLSISASSHLKLWMNVLVIEKLENYYYVHACECM